tara:strand:+ start:936 stop:2045 length:1110 start_codon:yes stop_codon:yes gene_type:complete
MFALDEPLVGKKELQYLTKAIKSGWISSHGQFVKKFEKKFAKYIGVKYAVSCASATGILSLLWETLNLKPGDEVIMQSLTFSADGFAMKQSGAKIVFADCERERFNISIDDIKRKITKRTKIIIPTHLYGYSTDMNELRKICNKKKIYLVEDCSQATGSKFKGKMLGSFGDFNIHSFHNKLIASGEGGMVTTNNKKLAKKFEYLKNPASVNRPEEMDGFKGISMNHRFSNLHAAVGLAQLERLESNIKKKLRMAKIYDEIFSKTNLISYVSPKKIERVVYWRYTIFLDKKINRDKFKKETTKKGITIRKTYLPLHMHPVFNRKGKKTNLPNCEYISKYGFDIPSGVKLKEKDIKFIAKNIVRICEKLYR